MVSTTIDAVDRSYVLHLANGKRLFIQSHAPEITPLVAYFAQVMNLQPGASEGPAIRIFYNEDKNRSNQQIHSDVVIVNAGDISQPLPHSEIIWRDKLAVQLSRIANTVAEHIQRNGGILLHAALVEWEGKGILLAAPGGTGKTTACNRLPGEWKPWSDDACLIVQDTNKKFWVHPWPTWSRFYYGGLRSGKWRVEEALPLTAVCFIEQAKEQWIKPMGQGDTVVCLVQSNQQMVHPWYRIHTPQQLQNQHLQTFNAICDLVKNISAFRMGINLSDDFWSLIEEKLKA